MLQPKSIVETLLDMGFTQKQIEEETGVSQATVSRILNGNHKDPRYSTIAKLSRLREQGATAVPAAEQSQAKKNPPSTSR